METERCAIIPALWPERRRLAVRDLPALLISGYVSRMKATPQPQLGPPWIVAHRGVSEDFPENTAAAFGAAIDSAADAIECDLQMTADHHIVVCHDFDLTRYGHPKVEIATSTLSDLQQRDIGSWFDPAFNNQRLLSLDELLRDFGRRVPLWLEVKVRDEHEQSVDVFCQRLVDAITAHDLRKHVAVLSFSIAVLQGIAQLAKDVPLVLNTHEPHALKATDLAAQPWLTAIDGNIDKIDQPAVRLIRDHDFGVMTFTCNTDDQVHKACDMGLDAIITNSPRRIRSLVAKYGRSNHAT